MIKTKTKTKMKNFLMIAMSLIGSVAFASESSFEGAQQAAFIVEGVQPPAMLGIEFQEVDNKANPIGVTVRKVLENSTAENIGLKEGDILLGIDNTPIVNGNLKGVLNAYEPGDAVLMRVQRGKENLMIKANLGRYDRVSKAEKKNCEIA